MLRKLKLELHKQNRLSKLLHKKFPKEGPFMALPLDLPHELLAGARRSPFSLRGVLLTLATWVPVEALSLVTIPMGLAVHQLRKTVSKKKHIDVFKTPSHAKQMEARLIYNTMAHISKTIGKIKHYQELHSKYAKPHRSANESRPVNQRDKLFQDELQHDLHNYEIHSPAKFRR